MDRGASSRAPPQEAVSAETTLVKTFTFTTLPTSPLRLIYPHPPRGIWFWVKLGRVGLREGGASRSGIGCEPKGQFVRRRRLGLG